MLISSGNDYTHLHDHPLTLRCPHCASKAAMIPISIPRYELVQRFDLVKVAFGHRCSSCNAPVVTIHEVSGRNPTRVSFSSSYEVITMALEPFELQYLAGPVLDDFTEALKCYAAGCWNAFAAMCRRTLQSLASEIGAKGTSKVQHQLGELKDMGVADEETFEQLKAIMLTGHDGAHPHLPALSAPRADVLLHIMKDVLFQIYVRPAKIREASELRQPAGDRS